MVLISGVVTLIRLPFVFFIMIAAIAMPVSAKASGSFDGDWHYTTSNESGTSYYGAEFHLTESGSTVSGTWGAGTDPLRKVVLVP